jgi:anti-sigma-K factor RskA
MSTEERHGSCTGRPEDAAAYALGALEEQEALDFAEHLPTCAGCREELAAMQPVVDVLPSAVAQRSAPSELRGRILSTVRSEAELRGASSRGGASADPVRRRSREWRPWRVAAAGLAVAAVSAAVALAFAQDGTVVNRAIRAHASVPGARAVLHLDGERGQLRIAGLPQAPRGHVYEVWVERAGSPRPTDALFTVSSSGRAAVGVPGSLSGATAVMVTSEPLGGSQRPTTLPVIVARLG